MTAKRAFVFDLETHLIAPGKCAPKMVCMATHHGDAGGIVLAKDARPFLEEALKDGDLLVGHNVSFDLAVCAATWPDLLPEIFRAYHEDRVTDTMLREKLWDIAHGSYRGWPDEKGVWKKHGYDLKDVARRRAGYHLKKDGWRLRYAEFDGVPLDGWPALAATKIEEARAALARGVKDKDLEAIVAGPPEDVVNYPQADAEATWRVYQAQESRRGNPDVFADEFRQARAAWWLHLMSAHGLRTNPPGVASLKVETERAIELLTADLVAEGLVRKDGSRDTKAAAARMLDVCESFKLPVRRTPAGGVSLDRDACKASGDPVLEAYGERAQLQAVLSKDVPMLEAGTTAPVHTRIDLAETGRTTSSSPNIQNLRRLPGIREAFVPRPGKVFLQADYPGLELRTLAQVCIKLFGHSALGDALNRGEDPHLAFAAKTLGMTYEQAKKNKKRKDVDQARQTGKVNNFGRPGGLGNEKLILFARKAYQIRLSLEDAQRGKQEWLAAFPEMRRYFDHVGQLTDNERGEARVTHLFSNRMRGGASYTAACNSYFQGLGADATKAAGFAIARACYVDRKSPLFGSRIVAYVHDEFILETPDGPGAHEAALELSRLMREEANKWLPDVPFKAPDPEPLLMRVWSKDAEALTGPDGRLVPWEWDLGCWINLGRAVGDAVKEGRMGVPAKVAA